MSRSTIATLALSVALAATSMAPAAAGVRVCNQPPGAALPDHVVAAINRSDPAMPSPWGYGRLLEQVRANRRAVREGDMTPEQAAGEGGIAITGTKSFPVFPFLFANTASEPYPVSNLEDQLFDGPWPTGTMREYYEEVSYGLFSVDGLVLDWTTVSENDTYYEGTGNGMGTDAKIGEAMVEILTAQDGAIDFAQFDNDGPDGIPNSGDDDGYVDFVMFLHPEIGAECQSVPSAGDNLWSHAWFLSGGMASAFTTNDACVEPGIPQIRIDRYFISAGLDCAGAQAGIGTTCHEFGHALGIKDLYDTTPSGAKDSEGLGHWCLMAAGSWQTQNSPGHMSAWVKERLGWLSYFNATSNEEQLCLPSVETNPVAVRLWTNGAITPEYFVIENRQRIGFDQELAGSGLVIYHVDEDVYDANELTNTVNGDEAHKAIDVECADASIAEHIINADDLDAEVSRSDPGDVWCTSTQTAFDETSTPDTRSYAGGATDVAVLDIGDCEGDGGQPPGWICATYIVGTPATTDLCMQDCASDGCAEITNCPTFWASPDIWIDNDDNGTNDLPAEGLENHLWFRVKNTHATNAAADVEVQLYYSNPALGQLWPSTGTLIGSKTLPVLAPGESAEDYVAFNYPATPDFVEHYCIGAVVVHPNDVQNSEFPPNDDDVAQVNHQVLVDRAGGGAAAMIAGACGPLNVESSLLLMPGPYTQGGVFAEIRLGSPPNYNDAVIPAGWSFSFEAGPYLIGGNEVFETVVFMSASNAMHGQTAWVPLTFWDLERNKPLGGQIMEYRVDCVPPAAPANPTIGCIGPFGDDLGGPNVLFEWDKVQADRDGGSEAVEYYEVFRGDNQGDPSTLVAKVAIDAERADAGFQWYDEVDWDPGFVYTYRVRAVDGAGAAGDLSAPVDVECPLVTGVGSGARSAASALSAAQPSPFTDVTNIAFRVAEPGAVELSVYDASGRKVRVLARETMPAGERSLVWRGDDDAGRSLPSGVYFYRFVASGVEEMKKVVIAR